MALKPPRICCQPGCGKPSENRYCEAHESVADEQRKASYKHLDSKRGTAEDRGYNDRWRRVSVWFRKAHPVCEYRIRCNGALATEVDHIIPLDEGGARYEWENLRATCHRCHVAKTWNDKKRQQTAKRLNL